MTRYHVELDLICPSNWSDVHVRNYIERFTPTPEERESIKVTDLDRPLFFSDELRASLVKGVRASDVSVASGLTTYASVADSLSMYAWIGEDELGSGVVGLKQAQTPAGMVPLAAMAHHLDRMTKLSPAMEFQATMFGKKIRLYKFIAVEVVEETKAGK